MKNKKLLLGIVLLIAVLVLGIAYAAIADINLSIKGSATATATADFDVKFTEATITQNKGTATIGDGYEATLDVTGLTTAGDKAVATYTIKNISTSDLLAKITKVSTEWDNKTYFNVTHDFTDAKTISNSESDSVTVNVTVELLKTPVEDDVTDNSVLIKFLAEPVQPSV